MKTDVPLKQLTRLCPADLLPLLGAPTAEVLGVEALELPMGKTSLDSVLRLRTPDGHEYLHLIEWQGYSDALILWRTLGYLAWLGQHRGERPILVTVIYLKPEDDSGETLDQTLAGAAGRYACPVCDSGSKMRSVSGKRRTGADHAGPADARRDR